MKFLVIWSENSSKISQSSQNSLFWMNFYKNLSNFTLSRSYISFDILRRVLADYFGYNVLYVMNITDVDDKIIKRARHIYFYEEYVKADKSLEEILCDHKEVLNHFNEVIEKNTDADKKILLDRTLKQ